MTDNKNPPYVGSLNRLRVLEGALHGEPIGTDSALATELRRISVDWAAPQKPAPHWTNGLERQRKQHAPRSTGLRPQHKKGE